MPGSYWKLRIFKEAQIGQLDEAFKIVRTSTMLLRDHCPLYYFDVLAAKSWLELRTRRRHSPETVRELAAFEGAGVVGRAALLTAQGFLLKPRDNGILGTDIRMG